MTKVEYPGEICRLCLKRLTDHYENGQCYKDRQKWRFMPSGKVRCLDCGGAVVIGEPCTNCGLGADL